MNGNKHLFNVSEIYGNFLKFHHLLPIYFVCLFYPKLNLLCYYSIKSCQHLGMTNFDRFITLLISFTEVQFS